ncbi:hypothetical protein HMPREF1981_03442 [Bacteroides pyogenes F0041]|uniref:Uncharacterized protein n=1 Tax=Bacteroides pyogenes F0041 TaxID=1321819 RepID=U2BSB4_9BACE|nr:hypothetical protein HMPREF1981_03442 [Bacteroides pyogenes F0041]
MKHPQSASIPCIGFPYISGKQSRTRELLSLPVFFRNTALHGKETGNLDGTSIEDAKLKHQPHIIQNNRSQYRYKTDERRPTEDAKAQAPTYIIQISWSQSRYKTDERRVAETIRLYSSLCFPLGKLYFPTGETFVSPAGNFCVPSGKLL